MPLLKQVGIRATFYLDRNGVGDRAESWRKAYLEGHEIACRGAFGQELADCTLAQLDRVLAGACDDIHRLIGVKPQTFAYPHERATVGRGTSEKSYVPLIEERFLAGRCQIGERANDPRSSRLSQLTSVSLDGLSFARMKAHVNQALSEGGWLIFVGHEIGDGPGPNLTRRRELTELFRYLVDPSRAIWLDTVEAIAGHVAQQIGPV